MGPQQQFPLSASWASLVLAACGLLPIWLLSLVVYRRFFHPLAKIPGPFLAAVTHYYIVKFNLFSRPRSQFFLQLEKLHKKYGPVIRISPDEIHLSDPENYEKIYYIGTKAPSKARYFYESFMLPNTGFGALNNELHRARRAPISPMFSRKTVLELEDVVQEKASKLAYRMQDAFSKGEKVDLHHGYRAAAVDVITEHAFGRCYNQLDSPDFDMEFFLMSRLSLNRAWVNQAFPIMMSLARWMTVGVMRWINEPIAYMMEFRAKCVNEIVETKRDILANKAPTQRKNIFNYLLNPENDSNRAIPDVETLTEEALGILTAAADTTGQALERTTGTILTQPSIHARLLDELTSAFPNPDSRMDYLVLEKLPYLTAVIKEGLRASAIVPGRLPRVIDTKEGAEFNGWHVPQGTTVAMSAWMMHRDAEVWPEPDKFDPERWMDPVRAKRLDKYLVAFNKGSRQCIGIHLAYCELYVMLATVIRRFPDMKVASRIVPLTEMEDWLGVYAPKGTPPFAVVNTPTEKVF